MGNNLYYILGGIAYGIFILQFIISWVAGEFNVDVDFDGDADFDVSDVVSFKGFIHFFMGFGGWTSIKQLLGYEVTWIDWLIGFFIGLVFVFMLYHLYKFCMKLQNLPKDEPKTNLVGRTATIYVHLGEGRHLASVNISGALRNVTVYGDSNTAGQFMANMAKNLAPSLEIARNLPIADSLKQIITGKKLEESPANGDKFPPVK